MAKLILAGKDEQLLPLLEGLRAERRHEVLGLGASGPDSLAALFARVMDLPLLEEKSEDDWSRAADLFISDGLSLGFLPGLPRIGFDEAGRRFLTGKSDASGKEMDSDDIVYDRDGAVLADEDEARRSERKKRAGAVRAKSVSLIPGPEDLPLEKDLRTLGVRGGAAGPPTSAAPAPAAAEMRRGDRALLLSSEMKDFAYELHREISRSKRNHLSFSMTLFRFIGEDGERMSRNAWKREPLSSFHRRRGRIYDSWGVSSEGILLQLAPETLEQARLMRTRLCRELDECAARMRGGPWRVCVGHALYPQDGEDSYELIEAALKRLERNMAIRGGRACGK